MKSSLRHLPPVLAVLLSLAALIHGPIAQLSNYHDFADHSAAFGIPHFADVASNLGFALLALWGLIRLAPENRRAGLGPGRAGYRLFLIGLFLTALGSSWYHLAPDNFRLVWDRLPIALACAGLLAGVRADTHRTDGSALTAWLALGAVVSVAWWYFTELSGSGDLRPYLLLQGLPLLLIPLWQWLYPTPRADRLAFGGALALYVLAKLVEINDHEIAALLGSITGHTLKHLVATGAAALIVARLVSRAGGHLPPAHIAGPAPARTL